MNWNGPVTSKKDLEDRLQELRNPKKDKIAYRKRKQLEEQDDKWLQEELKKLEKGSD